MSKIKLPGEKKRLSLEKDRRNVYGECPTSSRKNIRLGKQRSHQEERRAIVQGLHQIKGEMDSDDLNEIEAQVKARAATLQKHAFKKTPDAPLGFVIKRKRDIRFLRGGVNKAGR